MAARSEEVEEVNGSSKGAIGLMARHSRGRRRSAALARNVIEGVGQVTEFVRRQSGKIAPDTEWFEDQTAHGGDGPYC
jgi:hypothetical protein